MTESKLVPLREVKRHACPFYGFDIIPLNKRLKLHEQGGNQCAIKSPPLTERYTPCYMEKQGNAPDWNSCMYKTPRIETLLRQSPDEIQVFPDEFRPEGTKGWRGITFKQWYAYVMGTDKIT